MIGLILRPLAQDFRSGGAGSALIGPFAGALVPSCSGFGACRMQPLRHQWVLSGPWIWDLEALQGCADTDYGNGARLSGPISGRLVQEMQRVETGAFRDEVCLLFPFEILWPGKQIAGRSRLSLVEWMWPK